MKEPRAGVLGKGQTRALEGAGNQQSQTVRPRRQRDSRAQVWSLAPPASACRCHRPRPALKAQVTCWALGVACVLCAQMSCSRLEILFQCSGPPMAPLRDLREGLGHPGAGDGTWVTAAVLSGPYAWRLGFRGHGGPPILLSSLWCWELSLGLLTARQLVQLELRRSLNIERVEPT